MSNVTRIRKWIVQLSILRWFSDWGLYGIWIFAVSGWENSFGSLCCHSGGDPSSYPPSYPSSDRNSLANLSMPSLQSLWLSSKSSLPLQGRPGLEGVCPTEPEAKNHPGLINMMIIFIATLVLITAIVLKQSKAHQKHNHHRHHFQEVDLNNDGVIDYSEFLTLVKVVQSFTSWNAKFSLGKAFRAGIQEEKSLQAIVEGRQQLPVYHFTITISSLSFLHSKSKIASLKPFKTLPLQVHLPLYCQETVEFLVPYKSTLSVLVIPLYL